MFDYDKISEHLDIPRVTTLLKMLEESPDQKTENNIIGVVNSILENGVNRIVAKIKKEIYFTYDELTLLKDKKKVECVVSVKNRLGMSLLDAKNYVELHGAQYLKD